MEPVQVTASALSGIDIAKIVLASGVVAAVIGWIKDYLFKSRDRARDAKFNAISVIAKLDLYSLQSRQKIRDYHELTAQLVPERDYQNWPRCTYPELEITTDELRLLDSKNASVLTWLNTEKMLASEYLYGVYESSFDPTDVHSHKADIVGYFGYEAFLLAESLRKKHRLPAFGQRWGVDDDFSDLWSSWEDTKKAVAKQK